MNRQTNEIIADYQNSFYHFSNPEIKNFSQDSYDIDHAEFYRSSDYSVMLKRKNLYWMTKATVHVDQYQTTRMYLKNPDPKFKQYNKIKTAKNFYVFVLLSIFSVAMLTLLMIFITQVKAVNKKYGLIFLIIGGMSLVSYFIFYQFIFLWMQVEFRIFFLS